MNTIGFIGLGIMGKPMAKNLMKAGYKLVVYDTSAEVLSEFKASGVSAAGSPAGVAELCSTIILMLPNGPEVKQVVAGESGLYKKLKKGSVIIDMSSIAPAVSREMYVLCRQRDAQFIDAPVSGGEPKAIDGTLAIMVGCDEAVFDEQIPLLKAMGTSVVRTGEVGSGNVTKLVNQVIVALNIAALSEALVLGKKSGVDPQLIFEAIRGGLAGSTVMNAKTPMMIERNFKPGFKIDLHIKDLVNALETSREVGVSMPLTGIMMQIMLALRVDGKGQLDHSAIISFYEKLAKMEDSVPVQQ